MEFNEVVERFYIGLYICTCHFLTCVKGLGAINVMSHDQIKIQIFSPSTLISRAGSNFDFYGDEK